MINSSCNQFQPEMFDSNFKCLLWTWNIIQQELNCPGSMFVNLKSFKCYFLFVFLPLHIVHRLSYCLMKLKGKFNCFLSFLINYVAYEYANFIFNIIFLTDK